MSTISNDARQRFRQKLQSIEFADEIVDGLNQFLNRFILISNQFSSNNWNTVYTYIPENDSAIMLTFSIIAKDLITNKYAGFKRTAIFYKENNVISALNLQQSDFTDMQQSGFSIRFMPSGNSVEMQVKGATSNLTNWKGSIEIEKYIGE
jgi:hypothetical protein